MTALDPEKPDPDPDASAEPADLSGLIVSRLCHDLASPLGAIANGVELLLLSGRARTPETDLIAESAASASARLRFLRIAFGPGSQQPVARKEVLSLLRGLEKGSRLSYDWNAEEDPSRDEAKALFLLLLCLETAMPFGGQVRVSRNAAGWRLQGESAKLRVDPALWGGAAQEAAPPPTAAAQVQFALLPAAFRALGRRLELSFSETIILASF